MREKSGAPSLKWELVGTFLACWILPVLIIVAVLGCYISGNIDQQQADMMTAGVENAVKLVNSRLDAAIASSRNASYYAEISHAHREYMVTGDQVARYEAVKTFLDLQYKYDDKFLAATLFFCDDPDSLCYTRSGLSAGRGGHYSDIHGLVKELYPAIGTRVEFIESDGRLYLVRNLVDAGRRFEPYAVLVLELDTFSVFESLNNLPWRMGAAVRLNDANLVLAGDPIPAWLDLSSLTGSVTTCEQGDLFYVYAGEKRPDYYFSYSVELDRMQGMEEFSRFRSMLLAVLALALPLLAVTIQFIYRNITRPIDRLITATRHIKGGDLGYLAPPEEANREFHILTEAFNSMSGKLKEQFERIYSEELALRDARIMALQSQINPHFLNNTLEIINWEARLSGNVKVSRMIESLSTMLDAAMDRKGKPEVRLAEEMIYVDAYLYIISERLGKRLTVEKEIDASQMDCMVPRLILQPIIENAVEHGEARQRRIVIRAFREEESLLLEIENDGVLSREDQRHIALLLSDKYDARDENSSSLGIHNVHQRLRILYGPGSGLEIRDNGKGTVTARLTIRNLRR